MADILVPILTEEVWQLILSICFFFGLIFMGLVIVGGFGSEDDGFDMDDGSDLEAGGNLDLEDMDTSVTIDTDVDEGIDTELSTSIEVEDLDDLGMDAENPSMEAHYGLKDGEHIPERQSENELKSRHKMGSLASFTLFFGGIGLLMIPGLNDQGLTIAFVSGIVASKIYGFLIGTIAKNTNNRLYKIGYGDPAKVMYGLSYKKSSMVNVTRKDGIVIPVLARGASPLDEFGKGEIGFIVGKDPDGQYLIARKISGQS